jgi:UDP-N-acetylglucosamine acyltransferase
MGSVQSSEYIHTTAVVHPRAVLHPTVRVGAHCVIGERVSIGAGTVIYPNVVIDGWTDIGEENAIFPGAAIGLEPQDLKYKGEASRVTIGHRNYIRECVTINRATGEGEVTSIGSDTLLMAYSHVAHNCSIGDRVVIANQVALAGHIRIEAQARISGLVAVHQFTHIGRLAYVGGMARVDRDVPPFTMVEGNPGRIRGLNLVGLKRSGVHSTEASLKRLKEAYRLLYRSGLLMEKALQELAGWTDDPHVAELVDFLDRSIHEPGRRGSLPCLQDGRGRT